LDKNTRRLVSVGSTIVLTIATIMGIPLKVYHKTIDAQCVDEQTMPQVWTKAKAKAYALSYMQTWYPHWGRGEWNALVKLWTKESRWDEHADNPTSTAYGIAQVLGTKPGTPAPLQIARGLEYVVHRYDRPSIAWSHWRKHGWY